MEHMNLFFNRIIRAAKLDANLYEEVEADKGALGQAAGVVVLSSIAAGLGAATTTGFNGNTCGSHRMVYLGLYCLSCWYENPP